jgi:Ca2+:H+ antiporter
MDKDEPETEYMSRTAAVVMLIITTALVAVCAEFLVDAIPEMVEHSAVSQAFIGLIILPIVGNAAEHVTAVTVATKNKMDLAIGIAVGSSIQIALFVTPVVVILGWCMDKQMSLYFNLFETVSLFVTVFVINFLILDGKSNYLEGVLLIAAYVIIAVAAFFYPDPEDASALGGSGTEVADNAKRMVQLLARSAYNAVAA